MMDDMYSLYTKVEEWEMKSIKNEDGCKPFTKSLEYLGEKRAYKRVREYIEKMGKKGVGR